MKRVCLTVLFVAGLLLWAIPPGEAQAFTIVGSNFNGLVAWEKTGHVAETFGLDPILAGHGYNAAAMMNFNFNYDPSYPGIFDVMSHPNSDWDWTLGINDLSLPGIGHMPDMEFHQVASLNDIKAQGAALKAGLSTLGITGNAWLDWNLTGPNTGNATLLLGAVIPTALLPNFTPPMFYSQFSSCADISVAANPVPEPMSMILFGSGAAGLAFIRRRKANQ